VLFIYETHRVKGVAQDAFEAAFRDEYAPALERDTDARLVWYLNHAHGSSISFNVVTVTAIPDLPAWWRLAERVRAGDLAPWARTIDGMRYGSQGALVRPASWSPTIEVDFGRATTRGDAHALTMYVEDTIDADRGDPEAGFAAAGKVASGQAAGSGGDGLTRLVAAFCPVQGSGKQRQLILLQQVLDLGRLADFYLTGSASGERPWSAGHEIPSITDTWRTRLLRAAPWSPAW
jgi:hypothetical protein